MSRKFFTHATPTLFNAGTPKPQMSSCFLLKLKDDSIEGIYDTLKQCASISKSAGGIGVAISNVRASGSYIRGTNGHSNGLVPMLRNFNETARLGAGWSWVKGSFPQINSKGSLQVCGPRRGQEEGLLRYVLGALAC